jgi:ankyrin repeat protein
MNMEATAFKIHFGFQRGCIDVVHRLLDNGGFKIDQPWKEGWTALMIAVIYGHYSVIHLLLDHGAMMDH